MTVNKKYDYYKIHRLFKTKSLYVSFANGRLIQKEGITKRHINDYKHLT